MPWARSQRGSGSDDGENGLLHAVIPEDMADELHEIMPVEKFIETQKERSKASLLDVQTETIMNPSVSRRGPSSYWTKDRSYC